MKKKTIRNLKYNYSPFLDPFKKSKSTDYYKLSFFLNKFFNSFIRSGKKNKIYRLMFKISFLIRVNTNVSSVFFFRQVISNLFPILSFKVKHIGQIKYEIPILASFKDQVFLSIRWLKDSISKRPERSLEDRIFNELLLIFNSNSSSLSLNRKKSHYILAFKNKSFIRYLKTTT